MDTLEINPVKIDDFNPKGIRDQFALGFDEALEKDLHRLYHSLWGKDTYRFENQPRKAERVAQSEVLEFLLDRLNRLDDRKFIIYQIADKLRYTYGTTDDQNVMVPIAVDDLQDILDTWSMQYDYIRNECASANKLGTWYTELWSEWNTYLVFIEQAKTTTGNFETDTFEGITEETVNQYAQHHPHRSKKELQQTLSDKAHGLYEKADFVGLGAVFQLMRLDLQKVKTQAEKGEWQSLLHQAARAYLFGEGKSYQGILMLLDNLQDKSIREYFHTALRLVVDSLQEGYRVKREIDQVDFSKLSQAFDALFECEGTPSRHHDLDEIHMAFRQREHRQAEQHLYEIESDYVHSTASSNDKSRNPRQTYRQTLLDYVNSLSVATNQQELEEALKTMRNGLVSARSMADACYKHDYVYWKGFGDQIGQVKSRSLHPRVKLYYNEAYAERLFLAGKLTLEELKKGEIQAEEIYDTYLHFSELDLRPLYVQEWIGNYGARRSALFGFESNIPETVEDNRALIELDLWIHTLRSTLITKGLRPELFGSLVTGYTEKLRLILRPDSDWYSELKAKLHQIVDDGDIDHFTNIVKHLNPYDKRSHIPDDFKEAYCTTGVHVHNVKPAVIFETMAHISELDWSYRHKWSLVGTTTSSSEIAQKEQQFALKFGISRCGITNRQLLKGGNQNRIMPNVPKVEDRESFYLTLDDDYIVSAQTLYRLSGPLYEDDNIGFSQAPLFFRASFEPGHSIGRHLDASLLLGWGCNVLPGTKDTSFYLPLGTGTLFRVSYDNNDLENIGGITVDPKTVLSGEDWAYGTLSMLMRFLPNRFAETKALSASVIEKRKQRKAHYIDEDWIIGDGVDFAPGGQRQKGRWYENTTRIARNFWFPALFKEKSVHEMGFRAFSMVNNYMLSSWLVYLIAPLMIFVVPLCSLIFIENMLPNKGYTALFFTVFVLFIVVRSLLRTPVYKVTGTPYFEIFDYSIMLSCGTFWSFFKACILGWVMPPGANWSAFKGTKTVLSLAIFHACVGALHMGTAIYFMVNGIWGFAWFLISGALFFYVIRFHENAPNDQVEKTVKIYRDTRSTVFTNISRYFSGISATLGAKPQTGKSDVVKAKIVPFLELFYSLSIVFILFTSAYLPTSVNYLLSFYLLFNSVVAFQSLIIQMYAIEALWKRNKESKVITSDVMKERITKKIYWS